MLEDFRDPLTCFFFSLEGCYFLFDLYSIRKRVGEPHFSDEMLHFMNHQGESSWWNLGLYLQAHCRLNLGLFIPAHCRLRERLYLSPERSTLKGHAYLVEWNFFPSLTPEADTLKEKAPVIPGEECSWYRDIWRYWWWCNSTISWDPFNEAFWMGRDAWKPLRLFLLTCDSERHKRLLVEVMMLYVDNQVYKTFFSPPVP